MPWAQLDDEFFRHPKARAAGKDGRALYLAALCYSASQLTDGFVPHNALAVIAAEAEVRPSLARRLVDVGFWHEAGHGCKACPQPQGDGWVIHDYLERQTSRAEVEAKRAEWRDKKKRWRDKNKDSPAESTPMSTADTGGDSPSDSSPHRRQKTEVSTSPPLTHGCRGDTPADDDDQKFTQEEQQQARLRAERKLAEQRARGATIAHPERWLETATRNELANPTPDTGDLDAAVALVQAEIRRVGRPGYDRRTRFDEHIEAAIAHAGGWYAVCDAPEARFRGWFADHWNATAKASA